MAPKTNGIGVQVEDMRICVVMVGLPARGKSYIAQKGMFYFYLHLVASHWATLLLNSPSPELEARPTAIWQSPRASC